MADLYSCTAELQSFALKASLPAAFSRSASLPGLALTCRQSMPMSIQCRGLRHKHRCVMAMQPAMSLSSLHVTTAVQPTSAAALPHVQLRYSCQMYYPVGTAVAPQRGPHTSGAYSKLHVAIPLCAAQQASHCLRYSHPLLLTNVLSATTRSSGSPPQSTSTAAASLLCAEEQGAGPWLLKSASRSAASWRSSLLQDGRVDHAARPASMPVLSCSTPSCVGRHRIICGQYNHLWVTGMRRHQTCHAST